MNEFLGAIVPITRIGQDEEAPEKEDSAMHLFLIVALGLAILIVIFALQNPIPVGMTFFNWEFEGSLALVVRSNALYMAKGSSLGLKARNSKLPSISSHLSANVMQYRVWRSATREHHRLREFL